MVQDDDKEIEAIKRRKIEGMKNAGQAKEPEVIVYSTPQCPYCSMAKAYLAQKKVKFTEYDVSKDQKRAQEMVQKSQQTGVPVLQINGRIIVGFDKRLIDDSLSKPMPPKREELMGNLFFDPFNV